MKSENLWPEFSLNKPIRSPKVVLLEQASFLEQITQQTIKASIRKTIENNSGIIKYIFEIEAPDTKILNSKGYRYSLLTIEQKSLFFYPCNIYLDSNLYSSAIETEEALTKHLKEIFNSVKTQNIIYTLISLSIHGYEL
ncbi:hypothetical protein VB264_14075 [Arcicella aquatica]|uniref:Uncharacterized protein n=1 Tax=Arcicella aquatica TaxID=217141 RepID=A0ABU5QR97_9BACT|nr:hypothetical protein [Arcicella aquatica]MEA5258921.1 hypothetical protein [Arcicella aquatica]